MKKLIFFFVSLISFTSVQSQCNSNPYLVSGWGGTLLLSDSSSISTGSSTNYSVSYLWDFGDGFISNQQNPCHTYGDISTLPNPWYVTLTVTYFDSTTSLNVCQDTDSIDILFFINPCVYGDLQISASGNNLTANQSYSSSITVCPNVYPNSFLWSNGDTNQTINVSGPGLYSCTVTSNVGCVFTTSYNYNGSLTPTFDCNQVDMFEANNDLSIVSFQSSYVNNNTFPELIDSLSFWDIFDASGINIGLYPMMWQGAPANFSAQNVNLSDSLYVCYNAFLYDSLYQHNLWASPPQGSVCFDCKWFTWDATASTWVMAGTPPPTPTFVCDPIFGCFDPGTGTGLYTSLAQCQSACSSSWSNTYCDSLDVSVISSTIDSVTLGTNLSSLGYTGPATYTWTEFTSSGPGTVDTSANPSFAINIGDTSLVLLELTIIDNNGSSWMCLYPTIIFWDGGSWIALRTSMPGTTGIDNFGQAVTPKKLLKIVDVLGRETEFRKNEILFYIYDDGSIDKKFFK